MLFKYNFFLLKVVFYLFQFKKISILVVTFIKLIFYNFINFDDFKVIHDVKIKANLCVKLGI